MANADLLRAGLVGYGLAGEVFHAPLLASEPTLELAGIVTGNSDRAGRARARYPEAKVVPDVDELWDGIDLLVVAAPNRFHAELTIEAVGRGLPVVVDKPLAPSVAEANRMLEAGGRVTVFQNRRWDGDFLTVKALLADGRIGDPVRFESRFERFRPQVVERWRESGDPADGGGQLADLGPHLVDQATQLFGRPRSVYAEVAGHRPGAMTDDDVFIALEHEGGVRSHLSMGVVAPVPGPRFRLTCLEGGFQVFGIDPQEQQLKSGLLPGDAGFGQGPPGRIYLGTDGAGEEFPILAGRYQEFYAAIAAWASVDGPPPVDATESVEVLRIIDAARRSSDSREVVRL